MMASGVRYCLCCGEDLTSSSRRYFLNSDAHRHLLSTWDLVIQRKLSENGLAIDREAILGGPGYVCRGCCRDLQRLKKDFECLLEKAAAAIERMQTIPASPSNGNRGDGTAPCSKRSRSVPEDTTTAVGEVRRPVVCRRLPMSGQPSSPAVAVSIQ